MVIVRKISCTSHGPSALCVCPGLCQQAKRRKEAGENRSRPGGKRVRIKPSKAKEGGGRGQSLLTQVLDKGRFVRLGQTTTLTPGRNVELRCKGSAIGWSYPSSLDTFNDSRLRFTTVFVTYSAEAFSLEHCQSFSPVVKRHTKDSLETSEIFSLSENIIFSKLHIYNYFFF